MAGKPKHEIDVCVLQNGSPIAETSCTNKHNKTIRISSSKKCDLSLPHYPLPVDIELIKIKNSKITLALSEPWQGYVRSNGRIIHLKSSDRSYREFQLIANDLANILLNDLRIMVKIVPSVPKKKIKLDRSYRASISSLIYHNPHEVQASLIAAFFSVILFLCLGGVFKSINTKRPEVFEELSDIYTMPFIHEQNFTTAPEALQSKLKRDQLLSSIAGYYRSMCSLFMGWDILAPDMIYESSKKLYSQLFKNYQENINSQVLKQEKFDMQMHNEFGNYVLSVPSVYGESFQEKLLRVIKKMQTLHEGYELTLNLRRKITQDFRNDPEYNWGTYAEVEATGLEGLRQVGSEKQLSQISLFNRKSDEEKMYEYVRNFGNIAKLKRKFLSLRSEEKTKLNEDSVHKVYIPTEVSYISFLQPSVFVDNADKALESLRAVSLMNEDENQKLKEPLIGQIDIHKVKHVIRKHRFQLNLCYELALRKNHNLKGSMTWTWQIDTRGKISEISLEQTTLKDRQMIRCIHQKLATWNFPHPKRGSVEINHRFNFEPQDG